MALRCLGLLPTHTDINITQRVVEMYHVSSKSIRSPVRRASGNVNTSSMVHGGNAGNGGGNNDREVSTNVALLQIEPRLHVIESRKMGSSSSSRRDI